MILVSVMFVTSGAAGSQQASAGFGTQLGMDAERFEQQRRLVEELKSAQSILMRRRAEAGSVGSNSSNKDQDQRSPSQQMTSLPAALQNGIHVDKPQVPAAVAPSTKKTRSEPDTASDSIKVSLLFGTYVCVFCYPFIFNFLNIS